MDPSYWVGNLMTIAMFGVLLALGLLLGDMSDATENIAGDLSPACLDAGIETKCQSSSSIEPTICSYPYGSSWPGEND